MTNKREFLLDQASGFETISANCHVETEELRAHKYDSEGIKYSNDGKRLLRCKAGMTKRVIKEGVETICDKAFTNSKDLEEIVLPSTLKYIGKEAFYYCRNLSKITMPSVVYIGELAFCSTDALKSIVFPNSLRFIGKEAFHSSALKSADLSETELIEIKEGVFTSCSNLRNIKLPNKLVAIGNSAFHSVCCREFLIPDGVMFIGETAIYSDYLKSVTLPKSLVELGPDPFGSQRVKIDCGSSDFVIKNKALYSKDFSIMYLSNDHRDSICIAKTVKQIRPKCFYCTEIGKITFEKGSQYEVVTEDAFWGTELYELQLPDSVKIIADRGLRELELTHLQLPSRVEELGNEVFANSEYLTEVWLPRTIRKIGKDVFEGCNALEYIRVEEGESKRFAKMMPEYATLISEDAYVGEDDLYEDDTFGYDDEHEEENDENIDDDALAGFYDEGHESDDEFEDEDDIEDDYDEEYETGTESHDGDGYKTIPHRGMKTLAVTTDVAWEKLGLKIENMCVEKDYSDNLGLHFEVSGKPKYDFNLCAALYDKNGQIKDTSLVKYFDSDDMKYKVSKKTIISTTIYLNTKISKIAKIHLYID